MFTVNETFMSETETFDFISEMRPRRDETSLQNFLRRDRDISKIGLETKTKTSLQTVCVGQLHVKKTLLRFQQRRVSQQQSEKIYVDNKDEYYTNLPPFSVTNL